MESVSIVNNGSKVTEKWMSEYAYYLDIMAVSCDSFDGETNKRIGRFAKVSTHKDVLEMKRTTLLKYL